MKFLFYGDMGSDLFPRYLLVHLVYVAGLLVPWKERRKKTNSSLYFMQEIFLIQWDLPGCGIISLG